MQSREHYSNEKPQFNDTLEVGLSGSRRGFIVPSPRNTDEIYRQQESSANDSYPILISPAFLQDYNPQTRKTSKLRSPGLLHSFQQSKDNGRKPRSSIGQEGSAHKVRAFQKKEHQMSSRDVSLERDQFDGPKSPMAFVFKKEQPIQTNLYHNRYAPPSRTINSSTPGQNTVYNTEKDNTIFNESIIQHLSDEGSVVGSEVQERHEIVRPNPLQSTMYGPSSDTQSVGSRKSFVDRTTTKMIMDMNTGRLVPEASVQSQSQVLPPPMDSPANQRANLFSAHNQSFTETQTRQSALEYFGVESPIPQHPKVPTLVMTNLRYQATNAASSKI